MLSKINLAAGFLTCCMTSYAQFQDPSIQIEELSNGLSAYDQLGHVVELLDKSELTTGLLIDRAYQLVAYSNFDAGLSTTIPTATYSEWKRLYGTLTTAAIEQQYMLPGPGLFLPFEDRVPEEELIPVGIINMDYHRFKNGIIDDGQYFINQNNQLLDVPGRLESPYVKGNVFASTVVKEITTSNKAKFIVEPGLIFNNTSLQFQSLQIDFDDGMGFRTVNIGEVIDISFNHVGDHNFHLKATFDDGTMQQCKMSFRVERFSLQNRYSFTPDETIVFNPNSNHSGGLISIVYGCGDHVLRKPFIVVEGYDPSTLKPIHAQHYEDYIEQFSGQAPLEREDLEQEGYDIVYIDWFKGDDDIFRNSELVQEVIAWVNNQKALNGSTQENVTMGISMGALCLKHALRSMELAGIDHETRKYISFDGPHHGANVPLAYQYAALELGDIPLVNAFTLRDFVPGLQNAYDLLELKATRQMLIHHAMPQYAFESHLFYNQLNAIGYPQNGVEIVAISNGSEIMENQGYGAHHKYVDIVTSHHILIPWIKEYIQFAFGATSYVDIELWGLPDYSTNWEPIHHHFVSATILWQSVTIDGVTIKVKEKQPLDNSPGGNHASATFLEVFDFNNYAGVFIDPSSLRFSFVPSISSLDLDIPSPRDPFFDVANSNIIANNITPFADYTSVNNAFNPAIDNEQHIWYSGNNTQLFGQALIDFDVQLNDMTPQTIMSDEYNYGEGQVWSTTDQLISSVNVDGSGILCVNCDQSVAYLSEGNNTPVAGDHFDVFVTADCGTSPIMVDVFNGGRLRIGENNSGNTGAVFFQNSTTLRLGSGGKLQVADNSRLVIEEGATLIFENGASIELLGDEAVLEIRGELILGDDADFTFTNPGTNSGYIKFDVPFNPCSGNNSWACPVIYGGNNSSITLVGSGRTDKVLEIVDGDAIIPSSVSLFKLLSGKVTFGTSDARLSLGSARYQLLSSDFVGAGGRGIDVYGNPLSAITSCTFDNVNVRGALFYGNNPIQINASDFINGACLRTYGAGGQLQHVNFEGQGNVGWSADGAVLPQVYNLGLVSERNTGVNNTPSNTGLFMQNVQINQFSAYGVLQSSGELSLRCCDIQNNNQNTGIGVFQGQLNMSVIDGNGYNKVRGCNMNVTFDLLDLLNVDVGYNDFTSGRFWGTMNYGCGQGPATLNGNGNKWFNFGGPLDPNVPQTLPLPTVKIETNELNPCQVYLNWQLQPSNFPATCNALGDGDSEPKNHPLVKCTGCPGVNGQLHVNVKLNDAILDAFQTMELADPTKDDFLAIHLFHDIFMNVSFDMNDPDQVFLKKYAYNKTKLALQNCFANDRISSTENATSFHQCVQEYYDILQLIKVPVNAQNSNEQFRLLLDEALLYHLVGRRLEAITHLGAIENCYLTNEQRKLLQYWKVFIEIEEQIVTGQIPKEEAIEALKALEQFKPEIPERQGEIGQNATIASDAIIGANPSIGEGASIGSQVVLGNDVAIGSHTSIAKEVNIGDLVSIGDNVAIEKEVIIGSHVVIGNNVTIAKETVIGDHVIIQDDATIDKEVVLAAGTFIGANASLEKEVELGSNVIIRDGAVISKSSVLGDGAVIGADAFIGNYGQVGMHAELASSVQIGNNVTACDFEFVNQEIGNNQTQGGCQQITPPTQVVEDCRFALDYARNQSDFLNGFTISPEVAVTGKPVLFMPAHLSKNYQWDFGGCQLSNDAFPVIHFDYPGIYVIRLTQSDDCSSATMIGAISVYPNPDIEINHELPVCFSSEAVNFERNVDLGLMGTPTCQPSSSCTNFKMLPADRCRVNIDLAFGDGTAINESILVHDLLQNQPDDVSHHYASAENFECVVQGDLEYQKLTTLNWISTKETKEQSIAIEATGVLDAQIQFDPMVCAPGMLQLHAQVKGGEPPYNYLWSDNEGNTTIGMTPSVMVTQPGTETFQLAVTDDNGCLDLYSLDITIADCGGGAAMQTVISSGNKLEEHSDPPVAIATVETTAVNVFPNPSNGQFMFQFTDLREGVLEISSLKGQVILRQKVDADHRTLKIDLQDYASGAYLYHYTEHGRPVSSGTLIIK